MPFLFLYKWAIALALIVVMVLGSLYGGYRIGQDLKQGEWDASVVANQAGEDAALKAAAEAIAKIEVKSEKHIYPIRTEVRTNTVYRDCQHSPDSLRHLNALITGAESVDYGLVPKADSAR